MEIKRKYAFFDVCGTLTKNNNTEDYVRFIVKEPIPKSVERIKLVLRLQKYDEKYLEKMAEEYVAYLKQNELFNDQIVEKLKNYKRNGYTIYLISGSIYYPIKAIADFFKIKWKASIVKKGVIKSDLLDNKEAALDEIKDIDYEKSVFYTDNWGDKKLFSRFKSGRTFFIDKNPDVDSVTKQNYIYTYFPGVYYLISRLHGEGLIKIFLLRELVPISAILILNGGNIAKLLLSYWIFYAIYEIGALWNDTHFGNEEKPTKRISSGVNLNLGLFVAIRFLLVIYYPPVLICLPIFFIHTLINKKYRVITLALLRILRTFLPIYYLLNNRLILEMGIISFLVYQIPTVIYYYFFFNKIIKGKYLIIVEMLIYILSLPVAWILDKKLLWLIVYLLVVRVVEIKKDFGK